MAHVLYRKYRAQDFSQLFGQEFIVKVLKQAVRDQKVAHAYLFTGPRGTGKTSTARILAKSLNCLNLKDGEPCNVCRNCVAITEGKFLDLIEIDAASNRGIDEIRALKEKVGFVPAEGKYKIYIIDEVHMLTSEAFNALLKTLEEPPPQVVFILATTEAHKLPLTIISRTQRFDFRLANNDQLGAKLKYVIKQEKAKVADDALQLIIQGGQGSFRDAETILEKVLSGHGDMTKQVTRQEVEQILGYASAEIVDGVFENVAGGNTREAMDMLHEAENKGLNLSQFIKQLLEKARLEMVAAINGEASKYSLEFLTTFIREFSEANNALKVSLINVLPLEVAIVRLGGAVRQPVQIPVKKAPEAALQPSQVRSPSQLPVPEVKSEPEPQPVIENSGAVDSKTIEASWDKILQAAKVYNHHMVAMLAKVRLLEVKEDHLLLEVPFDFHKKRLLEKRTQEIFHDITQKLFGVGLFLTPSLNKDLAQGISVDQADESGNKNIVEEIFSDMI